MLERVVPEPKTYLEQIELANYCLQERSFWEFFANQKQGEFLRFVRGKRKLENHDFYTRQWGSTEEVLAALRQLAKDMETSELYGAEHCTKEEYRHRLFGCQECQQQHGRHMFYLRAVQLELIDSVGDLQRKADFLFSKLMKLDLAQFALAMSQEGMQSIIEKAELAARLEQVLSKISGTSIESKVQRHASLLGLRERLNELYPGSRDEIERMIESERMRLTDEP